MYTFECHVSAAIQVTPSFGPSQGGTTISIEGVNTDVSLANIDAIMIGTELCTILRNYTTSHRLVRTLRWQFGGSLSDYFLPHTIFLSFHRS